MTRKRANREGSIYKRKDGRWCATITLGYEGGKRRRQVMYGRRRQDVERELREELKKREDGLPVVGKRQTVAQYLTSWLDSVKSDLKPRTHQRYAQYVNLHALPEIGRLPLAKLGPEHLERLKATKLAAGLSPMSVRHLLATLHTALAQAVEWGSLARNVAALVKRPKVERKPMQTLSAEEARRFLEAAEGDRYHALYVLALSTGMRQGELLALKWEFVDLERGTAQVRGSLEQGTRRIAEPKTRDSSRQVMLTKAAVEALRRHRKAQAEERLRAVYWDNQGLVFCTAAGTPVEVGNLMRRSFHPLLERAEIRRIRFHDLRHTAATLLMKQGVHPKMVADLLGHSRISTTLDLYSHTTPAMQKEAVAAMEAVLGG